MKEKWNERYSGNSFFYGTEPNDFLKSVSSQISHSGNVLCLADGEGRNSVYLAELGHQVTAIDISETGLAKAQSLAQSRNVKIRTDCQDIADFEFKPEVWDAIVLIWCHLPSQLRKSIAPRIVSSLRTGGVLIIEAYTPDQIPLKTGGPQDPDLMPNATELRETYSSLRFLTLHEIQREVHEGAGHNGVSQVVQALGIKE